MKCASSIRLQAVAKQALKTRTKKQCTKPWSAMAEIAVPIVHAEDGRSSLDATFDHVAYQLFRDGALRYSSVSRGDARNLSEEAIKENVAKEIKRRVDAQQTIKELNKGTSALRRSVTQSALVIGCDEAGRGPLAGPVVGAAVSRVLRDAEGAYPVRFAVFDSKRMTEDQRLGAFCKLTGAANVFSLVSTPPGVLWCTEIASGKNGSASPKKSSPASKVCERPNALPLLHKSILAEGPNVLCMSSTHQDHEFDYHVAFTVANHAYVDKHNIFASSMTCMHMSASAVWDSLNRSRSGEELYRRYCSLSHSDHVIASDNDEDGISKPSIAAPPPPEIPLFECSAQNQAPVVLIDGSHVPLESTHLFEDVEVQGIVQSVVKGDARSWSIAAASIIAKVVRDGLMETLHEKYPQYEFASHQGYPVPQHLKLLKKHGLSPVHRLTYKPCARIAGIEQKREKTKKKAKK